MCTLYIMCWATLHPLYNTQCILTYQKEHYIVYEYLYPLTLSWFWVVHFFTDWICLKQLLYIIRLRLVMVLCTRKADRSFYSLNNLCLRETTLKSLWLSRDRTHGPGNWTKIKYHCMHFDVYRVLPVLPP